MTNAELRQTALRLPIEERQQLVEELWESLEPHPAELPEWQCELLDRRRADLRKNPRRGSSWEEVEKRVFAEDE